MTPVSVHKDPFLVMYEAHTLLPSLANTLYIKFSHVLFSAKIAAHLVIQNRLIFRGNLAFHLISTPIYIGPTVIQLLPASGEDESTIHSF